MYGVVTGLTPGYHGTHVHDKGDLREGCESTGGNYDILGPGAPAELAASIEVVAILADENGVADFDLFFPGIPICGPQCILGRSIVIHTEPSGGPRVACGIIGLIH